MNRSELLTTVVVTLVVLQVGNGIVGAADNTSQTPTTTAGPVTAPSPSAPSITTGTATTTETPNSTAQQTSPPTGTATQPTGTATPPAKTLTPSSDADFEVVSVSTDAPVGGSGTLTVVLENQGEDARNAVVTLQSLSALRFGSTVRTSQFVGEWNEGEQTTITVDVTVPPTAAQRSIPVEATVSYEDNGNPVQSAPHRFGVTPAAEQEFTLENVESSLSVGSDGTVSGTITNEGPNAATNAVLVFTSNASGLTPRQSSVVLGDLESGESTSFEFPMTVSRRAATGDRQLSFIVKYRTEEGTTRKSAPLDAKTSIGEHEDDFEVLKTTSSVPIGEQGTIQVTLENTGENATEAVVHLRSLSPDLTLGRSANATQFVGEWPAGERRTVEFQVTASNESTQRSYPFQTSVTVVADGDRKRSDPQTFGITPLREQSFSLHNLSGNLSVGAEGTVTGTITNDGAHAVKNAVISISVGNKNLNPLKREYPVGRIPAGESRPFSFPIEVTESADGGPQQLSFIVEYDTAEGDSRRSSALDGRVDVAPQIEEFVVEPRNASVPAGGSDTVTVVVTNNRNRTVRNINAKAYVDDPLSLARDEAYIPELGPNESATVTFELSASGNSAVGSYPLSIDFQYDTDGESVLSETYDVPVQIRTADGGGLLSSPGVLLIVVLLVVGAVGLVWFRRR